jgi:hypothetical protein
MTFQNTVHVLWKKIIYSLKFVKLFLKHPVYMRVCLYVCGILKDIAWEVVDWINLAQDRDQLRVLVNTVMNHQILWNDGKFLGSWVTISFTMEFICTYKYLYMYMCIVVSAPGMIICWILWLRSSWFPQSLQTISLIVPYDWVQPLVYTFLSISMQSCPSTRLYISNGLRNGSQINQQTSHGHFLPDLFATDKSTEVRTRRLPQNWMMFCEIIVPVEKHIPVKFYFFMTISFLRADIQICQKYRFFGTSCLRKGDITSTLIEAQSSFAYFKDNKVPFPVTY